MISIVVPIYNERQSLEILCDEIKRALAEIGEEGEILLIDDGSLDGSWQVIENLAARSRNIQGYRFRRNFGKAAALNEGFRRANGDWVITMDADLQDDPAEISRLLSKAREGFDVVSGWKQMRYDPWHKVFPSLLFNCVVSWLTGAYLHDHNCGLKAYSRKVVKEIRLYGELHRFIPVLAHARGFSITEIVINHRVRRYGSSKYGLTRLFKGFLDLLTVRFVTAYGERPLHVFGFIGLFSFLAGFMGMSYLAIIWLLGQSIGTRPILTYSLAAFLLGFQMITFGILAELIVWRFPRQNGEPETLVIQSTNST